MRNVYTTLTEKYNLIKENPLEVEIDPHGTHKSTHNVEMARTKSLQAAEVSALLHDMLETLPSEHPLQAWMVTHVTQSADMLQDVLAKLKEEMSGGPEVVAVQLEPEEPEESEKETDKNEN